MCNNHLNQVITPKYTVLVVLLLKDNVFPKKLPVKQRLIAYTHRMICLSEEQTQMLGEIKIEQCHVHEFLTLQSHPSVISSL